MAPEPAPITGDVVQFEFRIEKHGCSAPSGHQFCPNPFNQAKVPPGMKQVDNGDWLQGVLYDTKHISACHSAEYLKVSGIKRKGQGDWEPVSGDHWMPREQKGTLVQTAEWLHTNTAVF